MRGAVDVTVMSKIKTVYEYRSKPNTLECKHPHDMSVVEKEVQDDLNITVMALTDEDGILPSILLTNEKWVEPIITITLVNLEKLNFLSEV